jgi:hypothetical protein
MEWTNGNLEFTNRTQVANTDIKFSSTGLVENGDLTLLKMSKKDMTKFSFSVYRKSNNYKAESQSYKLKSGQSPSGGRWNNGPKLAVLTLKNPVEIIGLRIRCYTKNAIVDAKKLFQVVPIVLSYRSTASSQDTLHNRGVFETHVAQVDFEIDENNDLVQWVSKKSPKGKLPARNEMISVNIFSLLD